MLYTVLTLLALFVTAESIPLHASCKIDWKFGISCTNVRTKIVDQMKKWEGLEDCNNSEKCGYSVTSQTDTKVEGTHKTPVKEYVDDLTFTLTSSQSGCNVHGYSTSETWYAVLDYGTNYCNLHNLITGSGLNSTAGYEETTSNSICTQYSSSNCEKY